MTPLLHLDPDETRAKLGREPFTVRHELVDHPLTTLDALADLADELPVERVEHNLGNVPEVAPGGEVPQADMTPGEMVRTIETNGCWVVLPFHGVARYDDLLNELIDEFRPLLRPDEGEIRYRQGVFFLSAPSSVTPAHVDVEQGFLLQIKNGKDMKIGKFADAATGQREIERMQSGGHRNIESLPPEMREVHLDPGDGVHVPAFFPHTVNNGPAVSVSLSVAVRTEATLRESAVHSANARLRRLGLSPTRPGIRPRADRAKAGVLKTASRLTRRENIWS
jgi:hypothetical protein